MPHGQQAGSYGGKGSALLTGQAVGSETSVSTSSEDKVKFTLLTGFSLSPGSTRSNKAKGQNQVKTPALITRVDHPAQRQAGHQRGQPRSYVTCALIMGRSLCPECHSQFFLFLLWFLTNFLSVSAPYFFSCSVRIRNNLKILSWKLKAYCLNFGGIIAFLSIIQNSFP